MTYFPENTTTCFTTHLAREIRLTGDWLVGLAEIHVPCTIMHIQESESLYTFKLGSATLKPLENNGICNFPFGVYDTVAQLAEEINKVEVVGDHQQLVPTEFQKGYYTLKRTCACAEPHYTTFNEKIRRIFGFEDAVHRRTGTLITFKTEIRRNVGTRPACLARAIPDQLYVYTDICEPYTVGDTQTALLRIVSMEYSRYKFGSNLARHFAPIHYVPLLQHTFQNIVIDIRDQHGQPIPFEYGTLTATLHFKRNR